MKSVLITGYSGLVGGRLAQYLDASGRYTLHLAGRKRMAAITEWNNSAHVPFDLSDPGAVFDGLGSVDTLIHLAGINEVECAATPTRAIELNSLAAFRLFERAAKVGVKRVIYFSTAHVYGRPLAGAINENSLPRPVHPYAYSHRAAEDFVLSMHDDGKFEGVVVRLSNSFGSPLSPEVNRWTLLINDVCRQIVEKGWITMRSRGQQYRNFITLSDVSRATEHIINLPKALLGDGIFNVGGRESVRIIDVVNLIVARAKIVLAVTPRIEMPEHEHEIGIALDYSSERLRATGFNFEDDFTAELDQLLLFCQRHFHKS